MKAGLQERVHILHRGQYMRTKVQPQQPVQTAVFQKEVAVQIKQPPIASGQHVWQRQPQIGRAGQAVGGQRGQRGVFCDDKIANPGPLGPAGQRKRLRRSNVNVEIPPRMGQNDLMRQMQRIGQIGRVAAQHQRAIRFARR